MYGDGGEEGGRGEVGIEGGGGRGRETGGKLSSGVKGGGEAIGRDGMSGGGQR